MVGAVPFAGETADTARLAKLGIDTADVIKDADNAVDMARAVDKTGALVKTTGNVGELAKPYSKDKVPEEDIK